MARVGVFGGTFDPPHYGHLIAATEARFALGLSQVTMVPAGQPPHKRGQPISPPSDRLAMLRLATAGDDGFQIWTGELERPGPSYTADTLAELRRALGEEDSLVFIIGADQLVELAAWHQPALIVASAEVAVLARPGFVPDLARLEREIPGLGRGLISVPMPLIGISGRELRARVQEGRPIRYQVPPAVEEYIRTHRLYLGRASPVTGSRRG